MIEKIYTYKESQEKVIERVIDDANINLNHVILAPGDALPEHFSNSNVYLIISQGEITLQLGDQEIQKYSHHHFINVPYNIKMNISNTSSKLLEFFIVKSPNPANYPVEK
jgi:quercetin dioxygenase-like cupin family protein